MRTFTLGRRVVDVFTRPTNTTPYSLNDVISETVSNTGTTPLRGLRLAADEGRPFWLNYLSLATNLATFICTPRIHFYQVAVPSTAVPGDNAAMAQAYANIPRRLGSVDLSAFVLQHATDDVVYATLKDPFMLFPADDDAEVYYRVEIISGTPTPSSGQSFTLRAHASDN